VRLLSRSTNVLVNDINKVTLMSPTHVDVLTRSTDDKLVTLHYNAPNALYSLVF